MLKIHALIITCLLVVFLAGAQNDSSHLCLFGKMMQMRGFVYKPGGTAYKWQPSQDNDSAYYVIPTIVHIIYDSLNKRTTTDITDAAVRSEIKVLNEDFGKQYNTPGYNLYSFGADTRIRYCLATIDPNGNTTTGIEHIYSKDLASINSSDEMPTKNLSRWDQKRYLNIWIVAAVDGQTNVAGYSYLANIAAGQQYDGIVVVYPYFGSHQHNQYYPYNMGRTTTHECGHYFNLYHTWGPDFTGQDGCTDGGDSVFDTPPCGHPFMSQFDPATESCQIPFECGTDYRLIEDYMDYSYDTCMDVFTKGQADRMREAIRTYRPEMVNYVNIVKTGCRDYYLSLNPANQDNLNFNANISSNTLNFFPQFIISQNVQITITDMRGRVVQKFTITNLLNTPFSAPLPNLAPGMYIITVTTNAATSTKKLFITGKD